MMSHTENSERSFIINADILDQLSVESNTTLYHYSFVITSVCYWSRNSRHSQLTRRMSTTQAMCVPY